MLGPAAELDVPGKEMSVRGRLPGSGAIQAWVVVTPLVDPLVTMLELGITRSSSGSKRNRTPCPRIGRRLAEARHECTDCESKRKDRNLTIEFLNMVSPRFIQERNSWARNMSVRTSTGQQAATYQILAILFAPHRPCGP